MHTDYAFVLSLDDVSVAHTHIHACACVCVYTRDSSYLYAERQGTGGSKYSVAQAGGKYSEMQISEMQTSETQTFETQTCEMQTLKRNHLRCKHVKYNFLIQTSI